MRSRTLLKERAPDVLAAMLAAGIGGQSLVAKLPDYPQPGDGLLVSLRSRLRVTPALCCPGLPLMGRWDQSGGAALRYLPP